MTSTYSQLKRDLELGFEEGEKVVQCFLEEEMGVLVKNVGGSGIGWDLEFVGLDPQIIKSVKRKKDLIKLEKKFVSKFGRTFEVKRDKTSDRTNNLYWECWSNCRVETPGCMLDCKADSLVFVRKSEFIFLDRPVFLSWIFENLFLRTKLSDKWRSKTFKRGKERMMSAGNNSDVRGILLPVEDVKQSPACIHTKLR